MSQPWMVVAGELPCFELAQLESFRAHVVAHELERSGSR
jgi:hypothetical protein